MRKIIKKIKHQKKVFENYPSTKDQPLNALARYIYFNTYVLLFAQFKFKWLNELTLIIKKGDAGLVGNYYYGLYEFEESIFLLDFIRKEDLFLDIGANLGHYSLMLSGVKKCESISIEPIPQVYNQFCELIKLNNLNKLITPLNMGVSNSKGVLFFSTDKSTMNRVVNLNYKNKIKVEVNTLDDVIDTIPIAIKIDVEGYEKFVFEGGAKVFTNKKVKVLIVELNNSGKKYGIKDSELYELIVSYGFKPVKYDYLNKKIIELDSYNTHKFNTIFIRDQDMIVSNRVKSIKKIKILNNWY